MPPPRAPAATRPPKTVPSGLSLPRAMTVEDPMTTQLLAEVARRGETVDLDDASIDEAIDALAKPTARIATTEHPHTLRRRKR